MASVKLTQRRAQARSEETAGGIRDQSRMAATRKRRGATPASPTAPRRDALLFTTKCK